MRAIALALDGLSRNLPVRNTGKPIEVPVGEATLGRIMNVLGDPIDEAGPIKAKEKKSIHAEPPAFTELSTEQDVFETGIKV